MSFAKHIFRAHLVCILFCGAVYSQLIDHMPAGNVSCVIGGLDVRPPKGEIDSEGVNCVIAHVATAAATMDKPLVLKTKTNRTVSTSCEPLLRDTVEYWVDDDRLTGIFYPPGNRSQQQFMRGTPYYPTRCRWTKNGKVISSYSQKNCTVDDFPCRTSFHSGRIKIHSVRSGDAGSYACVVVEECVFRPNGGQCRLKVGRTFELVVGNTASTMHSASAKMQSNTAIVGNTNTTVPYPVFSVMQSTGGQLLMEPNPTTSTELSGRTISAVSPERNFEVSVPLTNSSIDDLIEPMEDQMLTNAQTGGHKISDHDAQIVYSNAANPQRHRSRYLFK